MEEERSNYDMIMEAIAVLDDENHGFVTSEWVAEHRDFFQMIRDEFPDLSDVNPEIRDMAFRNKAARAEVCARKLESSNYFDVETYCRLCKLCYELYEVCEDEDGLVNMFGKLIVAGK